jgi:hypothetical protein
MSRRLVAWWLCGVMAIGAAAPATAAPPPSDGTVSPALSELAKSIRLGSVIEEAAGDSPRPSVSPIGRYLQSSERRLIRGLTNVATFPVDTFVCPADTAMHFARNPRLAVALYAPFSAVQGAARSVLRLMSGGVDVVTCLVPRFEPLESPTSYHCRQP